jgi:AAA ATPase domain
VVLEPVRLISGEAGIGTPHLMHAALEVAEAEECVVLGGRAHDYDAGLAYASLKDVVASMPLDQLDPPTAAARDEFVVAADGAVRRGLALTSSSRRGRLRGTFALCPHGETFLRLVAARDPTVVALDDANLADDESLTALAFTARHVASVPLGRVTAIIGPRVPGSRRPSGPWSNSRGPSTSIRSTNTTSR